MPTSAQTIFHYTNDFSSLHAIIENGFYPSYCKESFRTPSEVRRFAVPMVSFCDIPLSGVKEHMVKYGEYAIGLSIEWAVSNHLNPVTYLEPHSHLTIGLAGIMNFVMEDWHDKLSEEEFERFYNNTYKGALTILYSIKPYIGSLTIDGKTTDYKFYDEREWRYTPIIDLDDVGDYKDIFWENEFKEKEQLFPNKPHFKKYKIDFSVNDIKYIIVKDASEVSKLIAALDKQPRLFKTQAERDLLMTKILTAQQIKQDF